MWAYRDPYRMGYDSVEANFYTEKPWAFDRGGDSQTAYYAAEIPDCTKEEAEAIGERAVKLLKTGYYSNAQIVVDMVLAGKD